MNINEAQEKMYELTEEFQKLNDKIKKVSQQAYKVGEKRRDLITKFPILDINRRDKRFLMKKFSEAEVAEWGSR